MKFCQVKYRLVSKIVALVSSNDLKIKCFFKKPSMKMKDGGWGI